MKKYLLKKYDDGKIKFYKAFSSEKMLLSYADGIIYGDNVIEGPIEKEDKVIYWVNNKWFYHEKQ